MDKTNTKYKTTFASACNTSVHNYEQYFVQNRTILCARQSNTLCIKDTVQNFVQYRAIYEQKLGAIFFYILLCKKSAIFCEKSAILAMLATQFFYCTLLHILLIFVNNIGTTWFADVRLTCPNHRVESKHGNLQQYLYYITP